MAIFLILVFFFYTETENFGFVLFHLNAINVCINFDILKDGCRTLGFTERSSNISKNADISLQKFESLILDSSVAWEINYSD